MKRLALALCLFLVGCSSTPKPDPVAEYLTAEESIRGTVLSPADAEAAMGRFSRFFSNVNAEAVETQIPALYAPDAFFNDTLKTIRGRDAIQAYFRKVASSTDLVSTRVIDSARSGENYYVRWVMDVRFKGSDKTIRTIGMTHLRFDEEGRIVLHQDFWDSTAGFFEHVPVLGGMIRWIKSLL
ncbi:MAG: nuclear transport factor 2 family protein [Terrimicrobiaceae bacterium]|nr:nuclear transport factor 2 family protein [Terrimicrobiaceae bacterium]